MYALSLIVNIPYDICLTRQPMVSKNVKHFVFIGTITSGSIRGSMTRQFGNYLVFDLQNFVIAQRILMRISCLFLLANVGLFVWIIIWRIIIIVAVYRHVNNYLHPTVIPADKKTAICYSKASITSTPFSKIRPVVCAWKRTKNSNFRYYNISVIVVQIIVTNILNDNSWSSRHSKKHTVIDQLS